MKTLLALLLSAAVASAASVTLSWDANPPADQVTKYTVYEETAPGQFAKLGDTPSLSFTVPDLSIGTHVFRVTASNYWGESEKSNPATTPPGLPGPPARLIIITVLP